MQKAKIQTETESYVTHYPEFIHLADTQIEKCFWTHSEIKVEKDIQDLMVNLSEPEKHGVLTVLKLFLKYELFVGKEYWLDRVMKKYPRPEIERMAACFGNVELNVHAPFYNKINEVLGIATDEFYSSYVNDPILKDRMDFIDELVNSGMIASIVSIANCISFSSTGTRGEKDFFATSFTVHQPYRDWAGKRVTGYIP